MSLQSVHSPPSQRRLSTRRGSTTAFDPFNVHAELNHNSNRVSSSTLTIVRVASPQSPPAINLHEPQTSPVSSQRRSHRRPGGSGSANSSTSPQTPPEASPQSTRLSFAFSSFSGVGPTAGGPSAGNNRDRAPSPSSSPRLHPSSPRLSASNPFQTKPRLTPEQLVDLARQSTSPRALAHAAMTPLSVAPAGFTPLPDDIYLPFIDRPSEVLTLISTPPDAKLFALLAQTLGTKKDTGSPGPLEQPSDLPTDPAEWTYRHLVFHLTKVDRDVAPDTIWAYAARKCIISHSELIWERVKGALGIPPELDVDWQFNHDNDSSSDRSSIRTEDISDDEGKAARGHWSDWDATIDSPVFDKRGKRLSIDSTGIVAGEGQGGFTIGTFSPPASSTRFEMEPENQVVIEPLIALPPSFSTAPPPLSLPSSLSTGPSDGLGDIAEGAEEEEEEADGGENEKRASATVTPSPSDPNLLSSSQIQGLKISIAPLPITQYDSPLMLSPVSPSASVPEATAIPGASSHGGGPSSSSYVGSRPHSRSSSFSSIGPFRRTESGSNIAALLSSLRASNPGIASSDAGDRNSILSELHLGGEGMGMTGDYRVVGTPLFPSNFARLASGPTLKSPKYTHTRSRTHSHGTNSLRESTLKRQSWGSGSMPTSATVGEGGNGSLKD
ncbi:hypothetical protein AN958_07003 [Leucoagaricus sp. SymC.cos]|nr:hypothetical protein AN958_07003 [Leucoagaricus sp. SymC.cos]